MAKTMAANEATVTTLRDARAVIFDLDDTLVNWRAAETQAIAALADAFSPHGIQADRVAQTYAAIVAENLASFSVNRTWMYVGERLAVLVERLGAKGVDTEHLTMKFTTMARANLRWLDGASEALHAARTGGRRVGLLTNGPGAIQRPKVEAFQVERLVDYIGITGEMGVWKPDAGAFLHVLAKLDADPEEAVMVGDSLEFDLRPAKKLGMRTVWVDAAGRSDPAADIVVRTPRGLVAMFR